MTKAIGRASLAITAALAFTAAAAGTASADNVISKPRANTKCGNPLVVLSPGAKVDGSRCSTVTVVGQKLNNNNSRNTSVLSALFGQQR